MKTTQREVENVNANSQHQPICHAAQLGVAADCCLLIVTKMKRLAGLVRTAAPLRLSEASCLALAMTGIQESSTPGRPSRCRWCSQGHMTLCSISSTNSSVGTD